MKPHDIRLALLDNGYKPLPLTGKRCYLEGWSSDEIDLERVMSWRRQHSPNAGIRCDNIAVIDLDITDEAVLDAAFDLVIDKLGGAPLERVGKYPKTALVYRLDEPGTKMRTGMYDGHEVEFLCGVGCQVAAIGLHPDTEKPYDWGDTTPLDLHRDELPSVKFDDLIVLRRELVALFESLELILDVDGQEGHADEGAHDLTLDMEFETVAHGRMTVAEIRDMLSGYNGVIRTNLTAFRQGSDSGAGLFGMGSQGLHLTDFRFGITHYLEPESFTDELAELLPPLPENHPAVAPEIESKHDRLTKMLNEWVHILSDNSVRHVERPYKPISMRAFENQHKFKIGKEWAYVDWLQDPSCKKAGGVEMHPGKPSGVFDSVDGDTMLNTYAPPVHDGTGEVDTFNEFITHLFPNTRECRIFLDWLAHKVQHPDVRMHAMLLVAQRFGTGRGTLFSIIKKLFGASYVTPSVDLSHFLGLATTSQSQYNDYMVNSLVVCVSEARIDGSPSWKDGAEAYERLKERVDTQASDVFIKRKTVGNSTEMTYASTIIATQHFDALPLPADDRRVIVLTNGKSLAPELAIRINDWANDEGNIAALFTQLRGRAVEYDPHGLPPQTVGRGLMIHSAKSALDHLAEMYVKQAAGDACYLAQFKDFCNRNVAQVEGRLPEGNYDKAAGKALMKFGAMKGDKLKISSELGSRNVIILRPEKVDLGSGNDFGNVCEDDKTRINAALRAEIFKNTAGDKNDGLLL